MGLAPSSIAGKDFEYIDDELINKVMHALNVEPRDVSIETLDIKVGDNE